MDIKAIIFDKDGTLIDFEATFNPATAYVLNELSNGDETLLKAMAEAWRFNLETGLIENDSIVIAGDGMDITLALSGIVEVNDPEAYRIMLDKMFGDACLKTVIALPQTIAALNQLRESGYILGIGTNDAEFNAVAQMKTLGIEGLFDHIHGADSGYGAKPGGGMIEAFAQKVGCSVSNVLMVGDSTHDLEAGKAAKAYACGVETGPAKRDELEPYADIILPSIGDLPAYLASQS